MSLFLFFNSQLDTSQQILLVAIFGLIFGSFASLISHRLITQEPMGFTRSKCPKCNYILKFYNLIPLFSWIFQGGKCSNCKAKISLRYPLIELSFLTVFLVIFFALDQKLNWNMILNFLIASTFIVMCITDLEEYFIPDSSQYFLTILVTLLLLNQGGTALILSNIAGALLYTGFGLLLLAFFYFTARLEAIGIDDIKFFFIAGFLLGSDNFLSFIMITGFSGIIFGSLWQIIKKEDTFPFAPTICFATFICMIFGNKIDPIEIAGNLIF